ncbi:MAG TPA: DNA-formamidopyrimidine glycosylase family protein [Phycisphaerae bacterium]|nr:DNA-formamidopyrimidine glycosylase family protein [Phycisphaerae bacterium]
MPELPDILAYLDALRPRVVGQTLTQVRILSPFFVRTFEPPVESLVGQVVHDLRRLGKRVVLCCGEGAHDPVFAVLHLMIAGRLRWLAAGAKPPGKVTLALFDFPTGTLAITEASGKKRASLHVVRGEAELAALDPGGIDVLNADTGAFAAVLRRENHTLKRALSDPRTFSGIGNAYSDEILHAARLSPLTLTSKLSDAEIARLHAATRETLQHWIDVLRTQFADRFPGPGEITAFRPAFAVHGKFGQPCPVCGVAVQRIRYAENETNYCPGCQTGGRVLADRSLSRLLRDDWPRTVEEL